MKIEIHSKTDCPHCTRAKEYLADRSIPFRVIQHDDKADREALYDSFGLTGTNRTVPQIVIVDDDGELLRIGGYLDLAVSGIDSIRALLPRAGQ